MLHRFAFGVVAAALAIGTPVVAQDQGPTANLQGNDAPSWIADPHMHAFYDLSVATLGKGAPAPDVAAYEQKAYAIFRAFAASRGTSPDAMQDHLKAIPRQMVQIVAEDPAVLDSYETFTMALFGPP